MIIYLSLLILTLIFVAQLLKLKWQKFKILPLVKWALIISAAAVFLYWLYLTYAQYIAWRDGGPPLSYFVPPYKSPLYVIGYHFIRFGLYYLLSFTASVAFLVWTKRANRRFGYRFFENEEPYLGALAIFLLGFPEWRFAWLYYLILFFSVYLFIHLFLIARFYLIKRKSLINTDPLRQSYSEASKKLINTDKKPLIDTDKHPRVPMYYLWIPLAVLVILVKGLF